MLSFMRTIWYDSPTQLDYTARAWLLSKQGVTDIIIYWIPQPSAPTVLVNGIAVPTANVAQMTNYVNGLNTVLTRNGLTPVKVFVEIPRALLELAATHIDPAVRQEAANQLRIYVTGILQGISDLGWLAGWYLFDEPGDTTPNHLWMTAALARIVIGEIRAIEGTLGTSNFDFCVVFNLLFFSWSDRLNWIDPLKPLDIAVWLFDEYPVRRFDSQVTNGEFSENLSFPQDRFTQYVTAVKAVYPNSTVGYVVQAYGYDPEQDQVIGITLGGPGKAFAHPTLAEIRNMSYMGVVIGDPCVAYWAHYLNSAARISETIAPVTQELSSLVALPDTPDNPPPWQGPRLDPVVDLPSIRYYAIDVLRADGVTWDSIWAEPSPFEPALVFVPTSGGSPPYRPNDGHFKNGVALTDSTGLTANSFLPGDKSIRVQVSKTATMIAAWVRLSFDETAGGGIAWDNDLVQRYDLSDPQEPGFVTTWDGLAETHFVYFDLAAMRAGTSGNPVARPSGVPVLATFYPNCNPFSDGTLTTYNEDKNSEEYLWRRWRANYPQVTSPPLLPLTGDNFGIWYKILRTGPVSTDVTPAYLLLINNSGFVVPLTTVAIPGVDLGFPFSPLPLVLHSGVFRFKAFLYEVPTAVTGTGPTFTVDLSPAPGAVLNPYEVVLLQIRYAGFP
ncbi:MAG: hypothetical protein ABI743_02630 [bacterium]